MGVWIRSDSIGYGRNNDFSVPDDKAYVKCSKCGFICNTERDTSGPRGSHLGYGIGNVQLYTETTITNGVVTVVTGTT